jgi:hypothetical protein
MTTETLDLITGVVEEIIAAIPQIVVVLTTVVYSLNAIKQKVNTFPLKMEETKKNLNTSFEQTKKDLLLTTDEVTKKIQLSVEASLVSMGKELQGYKQQLQSESDQVNLLVRQNKVFIELLTSLATKEPSKLKEDVSKIIAQRSILSKQELENYPTLLVKELPMLEKALKEAYLVLGESKLKEILGKIGYGKEN